MSALWIRRSLSSSSSSSSGTSRPPALPERQPSNSDSLPLRSSNNDSKKSSRNRQIESSQLAGGGGGGSKRRPPPPPLVPPPPEALAGHYRQQYQVEEQQQQPQQHHRHPHQQILVKRSNSMDRSHFRGDLSLPATTFPATSTENFVGAVSSSSGRHSHVFSPTKEALLEHNLKTEASHPSSMQLREVEELRARCAQMEKTMKWWSDCTANWRDKWSKVRSERNRYKDDAKRLSARLDSQLQEISNLRREREELKARLAASTDRSDAAVTLRDATVQTKEAPAMPTLTDRATNTKPERSEDLTVTSANFLMASSPPRNPPKVSTPSAHSESIDSGVNPSLDCDNADDERKMFSRFLNDAVISLAGAEQASMLKFRLDEAIKTLDVERSDKQVLVSQLESLQKEVGKLETLVDELRLERQEDAREIALARNEASEQVKEFKMQLEEQQTKKNRTDQLIGHLREELERLQSENAAEWGRCERMQTEKQNAERENKNLRTINEELRERTRRIAAHANEQVSAEMSRLQAQVEANSKELLDLRHQHGRLRKMHAEKLEELLHWQRKSEAFEKEVQKLRARIDELRRDLGKAEDANDESANAIRRLQRNNEELLSQAEGYQVQIEHLTSRLRALPHQTIPLRRPSRFFGLTQQQQQEQQQQHHQLDGSLVPSSSEESLPTFLSDEDDDDELDISHEIETDV